MINITNVSRKTSKIKSVKKKGKVTVYDFTVRDTHRINANGFYTSNCHHPEIRTFIDIKRDRKKVTGANISLRISDEFMQAVKEGGKVQLRWPVDVRENPDVEIWEDARSLWDDIVQAARDSSEPGLLFWDIARRRTPADAYAEKGFGSQSTNPCIVGDTMIAVADGRNAVSIRQLVEEGNDVPVYACDDYGRVCVRTMRRPRVTGHSQPIVRVMLDDGSVFRVTRNHKLLTARGEYVEASKLRPGDAMHVAWKMKAALNDVWKKSNSRSQDYYWLRSFNKKVPKIEHRLIYESVHGSIPKGHVIHHIDYNGRNNKLDNLRCMSKEDHDRLHAEDMMGEKNPIHKILTDPERAAAYKAKMSESCSGVTNGNSCGMTNDELFVVVSKWIEMCGYVPSVDEYLAEAKRAGWPQFFVDFRRDELGDLSHFLLSAAKKAGIAGRNISSTSTDPLVRLEYWRTKTKLPLLVSGNNILVEKTCESCGKQFQLDVKQREVGFCSHECSLMYVNSDRKVHEKRVEGIHRAWADKAEGRRLAQLEVYTGLRYELGREPLLKEWDAKCKELDVHRRLGKTLKFGFKSWPELKRAAATHNHRVVSVEDDGVEDVYNGTVDEFHNFYMMGEEQLSEFDKQMVPLVNSRQCGEIILSPYDSCRLMVVNLTSFVADPFQADARFDWDVYAEVVRYAQRLMDDLIDLELEEVDRIIKKIEDDPEPAHVKRLELELWAKIREQATAGRRTGLGVTGVGDVVAMLGHKYGDAHAIELVEKLYKTLCINSYMSSIQMAEERGAFEVYDGALDAKNEFLQQVWDELPHAWTMKWKQHGRRNIANTTTAPCGSVSICTQTTSGIEPAIFRKYTRKKKVNPDDPGVRVDSIDKMGDSWMHFSIVHHGLVRWFELTKGTKATKEWLESDDEDGCEDSPYWGATAMEIDWSSKVRMQAAAQKWVCHAISNTTNLPEDVTSETVDELYRLGYELGCKGITIYRDKSRGGVLVKDEMGDVVFQDHHAPKRPDSLGCHIHRVKIKGEEWTIFVGLMDDRPYEVFGGLSELVEIPRKFGHGWIEKRVFKSGGKYDLYYGDEDDPHKVKDIVKVFDNPDYSFATRLLSTMLRHGTPIQFVVEQLQKDKEADLFSFAKVMARTLKKYIDDGTKASSCCCWECDAEDSLIYQEGCVTCKACGASKC